MNIRDIYFHVSGINNREVARSNVGVVIGDDLSGSKSSIISSSSNYSSTVF